MISIQSAMLVALGFLTASLLALLLASAFWARAVRLTTARIKQSMPVSELEIQADRDRLRAEYAIKVHKLETQLEQAKLARARQYIELNRRDAAISGLETEMVQLRSDLEEHHNARRVLEQTVADRLPKVEARLAEAKRLLFNREREIAELQQGADRHKLALDEAASINAQQAAEIERLSTSVAARGGRARQQAGGQEAEAALQGELEALRAKTRAQATLIDRLQRTLSTGSQLSATTKSLTSAAATSDDRNNQSRELLAEADAALKSAKSAAREPDKSSAPIDGEMLTLRAKIDDQAGEIARLKAALAAFEQKTGIDGGLKDTKLALKARLGSAQAQADQQSATIGRLRVELAAANERLARQAAQFMNEMRRIGTPIPGASGQPRPSAASSDRRPLAERVAQVRTLTAPTETPSSAPDAGEKAEASAANGGGAGINGGAEAAPAAAEMPKAGDIPADRRRLRLLDRITGLAKE